MWDTFLWREKQYPKNPLLFRIVEGLSTGIMFYVSYSFQHDTFYILPILLFHWILSFLYHVFPSKWTLRLDWIGIHLIIVSRSYNIMSACIFCTPWIIMITYIIFLLLVYQSSLFYGNLFLIVCNLLLYYSLHMDIHGFLYVLSFLLTYAIFCHSTIVPHRQRSIYTIVYHLLLGINFYIELMPSFIHKVD